MEPYKQQLQEWLGRWYALSAMRKTAWLAGCAFCIAFTGVLWWAAQPEYRALYTGLSAEEAGAITTKLKASGVTYKLAAGGTTILVAADQVMQAHLDLSIEGTPGSNKIGKGLDLFDQPMLGATPFNQHVNFMRAQQAELARTIMQIDPIVFTRVHIVRPEPSPFVREQKPTTASVMVKLRPGATLNRNTISGITALVSGSIEGLTRENVRIVDASGRLLTENTDTEAGMMGSFIEQRKEVERYLASEAERVLAHVLGPGRAIVRVTAELNTKQMREKKEIIIAEGKVPRSEKTTTNKTISAGASGKGGAAGTSSYLGKPSGGGGAGGSTTNQETTQSEFDYPRTFQEWHNKLGSIDRITIAAFVDTSGVSSEQSVSIEDIQKIIKNAVGFKMERDEIQVTQVRVPTVTPDNFEEEWATHQLWQTVLTVVRNASIVMVALCACVLGWVLVRRFARVAPPAAAMQPDKLKQVTEEVQRNPEVLAQILTRWMEQAETPNRAAA